MERKARLMPDDVPRYIRCYDNQEPGTERYTVVYTGNYRHKTQGSHLFVGMNESPFHPLGIGQHGESQLPLDKPTYSHLGKKITFHDLPHQCKELVRDDYAYIWDL